MSSNKEKTPEQARYQQQVKEKMPKSRVPVQCIRAFISGGIICCIGQFVSNIGSELIMFSEEGNAAFTAGVMICIGAFLTGTGVYDKMGSWAGAGTVVPITGFANSIVSPAMEFKREGLITGTTAKMFVIAGPVLVYGICASVAVGLIYALLG